jgi:hydroxyacylglutathione hydrolase
MSLEDHVGDIISKARSMSGVSEEIATRAAGTTPHEFSELETQGRFPSSINFEKLAAAIGLNGAKLADIARGWLPKSTNLERWMELRLISTTQRSNAVNSYLAWDEVTHEAAVFDTGWDAEQILKEIEANQLQLRHVFITHSHQDHTSGLEAIRTRFPKVFLHSSSKGAPVNQRNRVNDFIHLGSLRITNRDTPGHAEDGTTYIVGTWPDDAPHVAIVGDAIFAGSIGRGLQSWDLAKQKIREQIFSLPPDTLICPGHGPLTTVAEELAHNPFF